MAMDLRFRCRVEESSYFPLRHFLAGPCLRRASCTPRRGGPFYSPGPGIPRPGGRHVEISATVRNAGTSHEVEVSTQGSRRTQGVPAQWCRGWVCRQRRGVPDARAGHLLRQRDLYREAKRLGVSLETVEVEASTDFPGVGLAASNVTHRARVKSSATVEQIERLLRETDAVAEVHNTVRMPTAVQSMPWAIRSHVG